MKTLYLDLSMGAAGDMLSAALFELLTDEEKAVFLRKMNSLGLPGVTVSAEPAMKCGITGTHMKVLVNGEEEGAHEHHHEHHHDHEHEHEHEHEHHHEHEHEHHHEHEHDHDHEHEHCHHHSSLGDIVALIAGLPVSEGVKTNAKLVYAHIAEAESAAHGRPVSEIHFHEVGTLDAVADVTAVALLMEMLAPDKVVASPVHVGSGHVHCAHGILPVPAPATAHILRGIPSYGGEIRCELCTPTGAALIRHFVNEFGPQPMMAVESVGYGMGQNDLPQANCVRALLGTDGGSTERIIRLECNVDDMTAEQIGFAQERLFEAGARDVYTVPAFMKKSRPGTLITVICAESEKNRLIETMFAHTSTLGVRESAVTRHVLTRRVETLETAFGPVRRKIAGGFGAKKAKFEYEDLARIAREKGISLEDAEAAVRAALR
ncbi:MAG: nickel pincer cofactor biosynthesis protein LarC [Clostridia bacterium]|nr:nickel pincer cofactor biosynthesis protein LarC [Clostridia bacterium]